MVGPKGEPGKSFFAELEEMMETDGSGEMEDFFGRMPFLEEIRGLKGNNMNHTPTVDVPDIGAQCQPAM